MKAYFFYSLPEEISTPPRVKGYFWLASASSAPYVKK